MCDVSHHVTGIPNITWKYGCSYNNYASQRVV
jgi:hypothetical protein